jgi:tetratricopeptide (TPR) repeat protein
MHALDASGNTAAALQHAVIHERRLKEDFAVEPPAELKNAAETLRARRDGVDGRVLSPDNSGKESVPEDHAAPASVKLTGASGLPAHDPAVPVLVASRESSRGRGLLWWKRRDALAAGILVVATSVAAFKLSNQTPDEMHDVSNRSIQSSTSLSTRSRNAQLTARHEAEDLYSQARYLTQATQDKEGYAKALALYSKAVERDPTFAKAYAGMADVYNYMEDPQRAKKSASKALALDSTMAEALNAIAYVYAYYDHRWLAADSAVERATRLSPRFTLAYLRRANINAALGRADVAFASLEKARAIEPESWIVLYNRGAVAAALGMNKEAIGYFESALALEPNRNGLRGELARQYWGVGRKDEAIALLRSLGDGTGAAIIAGDKSDLRALRRRFERDSTTLNSCQAASIYIELGEKDAAFRQLRRAVKDSRFLPLQLRSAPFVWLKDDPRYDQLRSDLGLQ